MKKLLIKIVTVLLSVTLVMGTASSCGLFEVDTDRDMAQIVATVKAPKDSGVEDVKIYKRDLIKGFMSYGYYYVNYYSYTPSQAYKMVLDNLVNNAIVIQNAKREVAKSGITACSASDMGDYLFLLASDGDLDAFNKANKNLKYGSTEYIEKLQSFMSSTYSGTEIKATDAAFRFVDADYVFKAISDAVDSLKSLVDTFMDEDDEEEVDEEMIEYTARTTPDMKKDDEEELLSIAEYKENIDTVKNTVTTGSGKSALKKAVERLKDNGIINSDEYENLVAKNIYSVLNLSYFRDMIESSLENKIVEEYEDILRNANEIKADELWNQYKKLVEAQNAKFDGNDTEFETQLSAVSDTSFVVKSVDGYAYVSHMLIGFTDEQKEAVSKITADIKNATQEDIDSAVREYAVGTSPEDAHIYVTDLRSSWVQSGYGKYEDGKFVFGDDYIYNKYIGDGTTLSPLATFDGTIGNITYHEEGEDGNKHMHAYYHDLTPRKISYSEFANIAKRVITGNYEDDSNLELGVVEKIDFDKDAFNRFEDLKFAYSTDTGNFNNYLGYMYSPITSDAQYVKAFSKASKDVIANGVGSYEMFVSPEYGLHIVLCTAKVSTNADGYYYQYDIENDAGKELFTSDLDNKDSLAAKFKEANNALVENTYISNIAQQFINAGLGNVEYNEKAYSDIITE